MNSEQPTTSDIVTTKPTVQAPVDNATILDINDIKKLYQLAFEITAADFNGKTFDGSPIKVIHGTHALFQEVFAQQAIAGNIANIWTGESDYAIWGVNTPEGKVTAEPGDIVTWDGTCLGVIKASHISGV